VKSRHNLRDHLRRIHDKTFRTNPCQYCGIIFCSRFSLTRHIASKHRGMVDPRSVPNRATASGYVNPGMFNVEVELREEAD
jgi:hypothetical protein